MVDLLQLVISIALQTNVTSNAPQSCAAKYGSSAGLSPIIAAMVSGILSFVSGMIIQRYVLEKQGQQKRYEAVEKSIKENREYN